MLAIESLGVVRQGVSQKEGRTLTAPRLFTSILVWRKDRAHIAAEDPLCFTSAGPPAPGKSSQTVGDNGCARRPVRPATISFRALKIRATRSDSQGISPAQSSLDLRVSRLCSAARPLPPINGLR